MGLDIGVATGRIEYLDRSLFHENEELHGFVWWLLSGCSPIPAYSGEGNAFLFLDREHVRQAGRDYAEVLRDKGAGDRTTARFEKALDRLVEAILEGSPDGEYALVHANW